MEFRAVQRRCHIEEDSLFARRCFHAGMDLRASVCACGRVCTHATRDPGPGTDKHLRTSTDSPTNREVRGWGFLGSYEPPQG